MAKTLIAATDDRLSWEAKGLMYYIEFHGEAVRRDLAAADRISPEIVLALMELFVHGYIGQEWLCFKRERELVCS